MLDMILAIKSALQTSSTLSYVKNRDIFPTETEALVRKSGDYPAIGIKDNGAAFAFAATNQEDDILEVNVVAYVRLLKQGDAIVGAANQPGILQVAADIISVLKHNTLGDIVETALPIRAGASRPLVEEKKASIQMLPITFRYTREA